MRLTPSDAANPRPAWIFKPVRSAPEADADRSIVSRCREGGEVQLFVGARSRARDHEDRVAVRRATSVTSARVGAGVVSSIIQHAKVVFTLRHHRRQLTE